MGGGSCGKSMLSQAHLCFPSLPDGWLLLLFIISTQSAVCVRVARLFLVWQPPRRLLIRFAPSRLQPGQAQVSSVTWERVAASPPSRRGVPALWRKRRRRDG